jgi:hypothetical protein
VLWSKADALPVFIKVFCEWKWIHDFLTDSQLMVGCLDLLCSHFMARLRCNSFTIITTVFALTPLRRASIRAAEYDCQAQGHVDEVVPGAIVIAMRKEFESILGSHLAVIFENARPEARPAFRALSRDTVLDALNPVPLDSLNFNKDVSDPDAESFGTVLEAGLRHSL